MLGVYEACTHLFGTHVVSVCYDSLTGAVVDVDMEGSAVKPNFEKSQDRIKNPTGFQRSLCNGDLMLL
jgi:hypothetical protein